MEKNQERPRDRYVTDEEFRVLWEHAEPALQDAMDLALLTGQRPGDVFMWRLSDVRDGCLQVIQAKTGKSLQISIEGELAAVIERIRTRARNAIGNWLVQTENGQRLTYTMFRKRFHKAREAVGADWQFRDLRAKSATDSGSLAEAQERLGHESSRTTRRHYRRGEKVKPLR